MIRIHHLFLSLLLLLSAPRHSTAEELPVLGLMPLLCKSSIVFSGRLLIDWNDVSQRRASTHLFEICQRYKGRDLLLKDTVEVAGFDIYALKPELDSFYVFCNLPQEEGSASTYQRLELTQSGLRPFKDGQMYWLIQPTIPGSLQFWMEGNARPHAVFAQDLKIGMLRADTLLGIRSIKDSIAQNRALFAWIKSHRSELNVRPDAPVREQYQCWGELSREVFQWINGNGVWQDALESIFLSKDITGDWVSSTEPYNERYSFQNPEARSFLTGILERNSGSKDSIFVAFNILDGNLWSSDEALYVSSIEQERILKALLPYLKNKEWQAWSIYLAEHASCPLGSAQKTQKSRFILPELKALLESGIEDDWVKRRCEEAVKNIER